MGFFANDDDEEEEDDEPDELDIEQEQAKLLQALTVLATALAEYVRKH